MPSFAFKDLYKYWIVILITGVLIACLGVVHNFNDKNETNKITFISHSASSVRIPSSVNNFWDILPTIRLSPLGSSIFRKYTKLFNAFKRCGRYPNVSKCNAKRCVCCTHICTKTTITSSFCSVLCLLCICARLFICALWSPAGKGLTSWLLFVESTVSLSL